MRSGHIVGQNRSSLTSLDHSGHWQVSWITSKFLTDCRGPWIEVRSLAFVHLVDVRCTVIARIDCICVASAERLVEASWSPKHSTEFVGLVVLSSGCWSRISVGIYLAVKRGNRATHWSTICWAVGVLAVKFYAGCTTAITGRSHCSRRLQIVEKALNLGNVNLAGWLWPANHLWWVDLGRMTATVGLVSGAVWLGSEHYVFGAIVLMIANWGARASLLLYKLL